jgi:hypothetical protein
MNFLQFVHRDVVHVRSAVQTCGSKNMHLKRENSLHGNVLNGTKINHPLGIFLGPNHCNIPDRLLYMESSKPGITALIKLRKLFSHF